VFKEAIQAGNNRFQSRTAGISEPPEEHQVNELNQAWASDITYVQLFHENVYPAVILDLVSRKCIGWELSRNIGRQLIMNALARALKIDGQNRHRVSFTIRIKAFSTHPKII
jgi:transposase InsO family protein